MPERQPHEAQHGRRDPEQQRRRHRREGREVRRDRDARHLVEVEQEQRRDPELSGDRRTAGHRRRQRHEPAQSLGERGRQRDHARRGRDGQLEADRVHQPRVEHEQRKDRRRQDRARRPRLAQQDPDQRQRRHRACAQDGGLRPREHDEEHDHAEPHREPAEGAEPQRAGERDDGRQHHGDVLAGDDEQMTEAGRLEVAGGDRIELRRVAEHEPEEQAGLARRKDPFDRAADERAHDLGQPDERRRRAAQALDVERTHADPEPAMHQRLRETGIVGQLQRALDPQLVAADGHGHVVVPADPDGLANGGRSTRPLDAPDVDQRVPAVRARLRVLSQRARERDRAGREPGEQRTLDARRPETGPPDPAEDQPDGQQRQCRPRGHDGDPARWRRPPLPTGGRSERARPRATHRRGADREPRPRRRRAPGPRAGATPTTATTRPRRAGGPRRAARPRTRRPPAVCPSPARVPHTVTCERRSSIVAGPMPDTSSSWSTDVNGPCSVR